jgi:hypothetical protein
MKKVILIALLALGLVAVPMASSIIGATSAKAWSKCEGGYARDEAKVARACM